MRLKDLFADEPCNTGRQLEIDLSKTVMLFELVLCHCFIQCTSDERLLHGFPFVMDSVIGGPLGASGYMAAMGLGMIYTRHNSPKEFAVRGLKLGLIGLLLNLCRFTIPYLIGYAITGNYEKYIADLFFLTFENDILIFASLAFLTMALLRYLKTPPWLMLVIAFAMSGIATMLNGIDLGNDAANVFVGYFIGTEDPEGRVCSYFTLFNWFVIPVVGYFYGYYYCRLKDKKRFHLIFSLPSLVIAVIYLIIGISQRIGVFGEGQLCYYHINTYDMIGTVFVSVAIIGIYYLLSLIVPEFIKKFSKVASANVTALYCVQWVVIVVFADLILYISTGSQELDDWQIVIAAIIIFTISFFSAYFYKKIKKKLVSMHEKKINPDS